MKLTRLVKTLGASIGLLLFSQLAFADDDDDDNERENKDRKVNCDKQKNDQRSLQRALNKARPGSTITVRGTCEGVALVISSNGVTLQGPADLLGTGEDSVVTVQDAGDVTLTDLNLSGGINGLSVTNARVNASDITANDNADAGFSVILGGNLACNNCEAKFNGVRGALVVGGITLCGSGVFADNTGDGLLAFLTGRVFSSTPICGDTPVLDFVDNGASGLSLFQGGHAFLDGVTMEAGSNDGNGIAVGTGSTLFVTNSNSLIDDNTNFGLVVTNQSSATLTGAGSTSVQNNGQIGVLLQNNSSAFLANATIDGNGLIEALIQGFSSGSASSAEPIEPLATCDQFSTGNLCNPPPP